MVDVVCVNQLLTGRHCCGVCRKQAKKVAISQDLNLAAPLRLTEAGTSVGISRVDINYQYSDQNKLSGRSNGVDREGKCGSHYRTGVLLPEKSTCDKGPLK